VERVRHDACRWSLETCRGCAGPPGPDLTKRDLNPRIPARASTLLAQAALLQMRASHRNAARRAPVGAAVALGSLAKWPWRCGAAGGSAACAGRGRTPRLFFLVPDVSSRAQLNEAPGRGAAESGCQMLRTVPAAILQRRRAGARRRRGRRRRGLRDARSCRDPDRGHSAPAPGAAGRRGARWAPSVRRGRPEPRRGPSRWPAGHVCELPWKCHFQAHLPPLLVLQSGCGAAQ